ncbi:hypothetical protein B0H16DRAFT_1725006 [Mycena metata]|uniref:Uncharacterized protein n=1 Tax=Mycena metata TaxID=1033252 RepID=A0AAD7ISR9_9AGAR|nr:hypothetical protein B0H16DRAFT_1725006 [Mycena metata]
MSGKKRKKATVYHFSATPAAAGPSGSSQAGTTAPATKPVLREKTSVSQSDGHVRQHRTVVEVPAATLAPKVHPDVRKEFAPIYDWYSGGDMGVDRADDDNDWEDDEDNDDEGPRAPRPSDDPLGQWAEDHLAQTLAEILRLKGRGDHANHTMCLRCTKNAADHRCMHCLSGGELLCGDCILDGHRYLPFH